MEWSESEPHRTPPDPAPPPSPRTGAALAVQRQRIVHGILVLELHRRQPRIPVLPPAPSRRGLHGGAGGTARTNGGGLRAAPHVCGKRGPLPHRRQDGVGSWGYEKAGWGWSVHQPRGLRGLPFSPASVRPPATGWPDRHLRHRATPGLEEVQQPLPVPVRAAARHPHQEPLRRPGKFPPLLPLRGAVPAGGGRNVFVEKTGPGGGL